MAIRSGPGETGARSWAYAVSGGLAIVFGCALVFWPKLTIPVLIALFGAYALIFGFVSLIDAIDRRGSHQTWWSPLLIGLAGIVAGIFVFAFPGLAARLFLYVIAVWAIAIGLVELLFSSGSGQRLLLVVGALWIVFGLVLLANPLGGALALALVIGVFSVIEGILLLIQAFGAPFNPTGAATRS